MNNIIEQIPGVLDIIFKIAVIFLLGLIEARISEQTKFLRDEDEINNIGNGEN